MNLHVYIDDTVVPVTLPPSLLEEAGDFFARMDRDMDQGWQMGREWVEQPNQIQRCQIAADKLLGAIESGNEPLKLLMAGYIISRAPGVAALRIDTSGEMQQTELLAASQGH
ncbi:MAG TPA: hypothetical protein VGE50_05215 [Gammaproteobacteria bacterium]